MALAVQRCNDPIIVQSDSSDSWEALTAMTGDNLTRSTNGHLVADMKHLTVGQKFIPTKIKRGQNMIAGRLTLYSRIESTTVWLDRGPSCVKKLVPLQL